MPKYEDPNLEEEMDEAKSPLEKFFLHQRKAMEETAKALEALLPPGFKDHSTEAGREFAKGFKILVDVAVDELKRVSESVEDDEEVEAEEEDRPATTGKGKVKVEVD